MIDRVRMAAYRAMNAGFDSAAALVVRRDGPVAPVARDHAPSRRSCAPASLDIRAERGSHRVSASSRALQRCHRRRFARFKHLDRPQMHDDQRKNALRLLLCELQCSINCVHVRSCFQTFCLALTVALPARRATLVLDTDFRLMKSAVRILPPRKKIIASIFACREAGKRGFIRAGFVPRA
jgi:hypothetical protein